MKVKMTSSEETAAWAPGKKKLTPFFQLWNYWAFTFLVAMVTAESTGTTKAFELFCVP